MRVLVTGGGGYIGSHACKAFAARGHEVVTIDNLSRGWADAVRWGPLEQVDLLDREDLQATVVRLRPEVVVHFAALAYVGESVEDPGSYYRVNVAGTVNLLDAMRAAGCKRIVFSSSCATYGIPDRVPIAESQRQCPINPYGWSKFAAEQVMRDFAAAHGVEATFLRYFNAAGCDPDGELGERHVPETHVIPLALAAALAGTPFTVNGTDFPTPDGSAVRDFIHVTDLARAHVLAVEHLAGQGGVQAFNLGTGQGISVLEIVRTVERHTGRALAVTAGPRRPGDPPSLVADPGRSRRELGFMPELSDIDSIVATALASMRRWASLSPGVALGGR